MNDNLSAHPSPVDRMVLLSVVDISCTDAKERIHRKLYIVAFYTPGQ